MSTNGSNLFITLWILAILVGTPIVCIFFGIRRFKTAKSRSAKLLLATGIGILCICALAVLAYVALVGPFRSGIVTQGTSPEGREYCIVQTFKDMAEPYQVSFYVRDAAGIWRWSYLAHQDVAWSSATVTFSGGVAHVRRDGEPFRDIALPVDTVTMTNVEPGENLQYCPSNFTALDILKLHNTTFR